LIKQQNISVFSDLQTCPHISLEVSLLKCKGKLLWFLLCTKGKVIELDALIAFVSSGYFFNHFWAILDRFF